MAGKNRISKCQPISAARKRQEYVRMMGPAVEKYLTDHFENGGTQEQLYNNDDEKSIPDYAGQHASVRIARLPIPATKDGIFTVKNLGKKVGDAGGSYEIDTSDLFAEASAMALVALRTKIPIPWPYTCCAADEKDPVRSLITMEYIEGEPYAADVGLTPTQRWNIIKQMAVIRIRMLYVVSKGIGSVGLPAKEPELEDSGSMWVLDAVAGKMAGAVTNTEGRKENRAKNLFNLGPYPTIKSWVAESLQKEVVTHMLSLREKGVKPLEEWAEYIDTLVKGLAARRYGPDKQFHLEHGDLVEGNNIILRDGKIASLIDWETAGFVPFSEAVADLLPDTETQLEEEGYGMERPTQDEWAETMSKKFGIIGKWVGWPLADGLSPLTIEDFDSDAEDSDSDSDGLKEGVGAEWWQEVMLRQTWALVEEWFATLPVTKEHLWRDPAIYSICRDIIDFKVAKEDQIVIL